MSEIEWLFLTGALSGGAGNLSKRFPKLPKWALPWLMMALGYLLTLARYRFNDGMAWDAAAMAAWSGLGAGLIAVGGHEALKPGAEKVLGPERAAKVLGKLPPLKSKTVVIKGADKTKASASIVFVGLLCFVMGCGATLGGVLSGIVQGATWLGNAITHVEGEAKKYHDRHPNMDTEAELAKRLNEAKATAKALGALAKAAKDVDDPEVKDKRAAAIEAFGAVRAFLDETGIAEAKSPPGGAENEEAPTPEPFQVPTDAEVREHLSRS